MKLYHAFAFAISSLIFSVLMLLPLTVDDQTHRTERSLSHLMDSLVASQELEKVIMRKRSSSVRNVIQEKFDWLFHKTHSNFFLSPSNNRKSDVLVFVRVPRTAGGAIRDCLLEIGRNSSLNFLHDQTDHQRLLWDIPQELTVGYREGFDGHIGLNTFGLCDQIHRPCSYFTVMRRPLDRSISSYFHCRQSLADPLCGSVNANELDLRTWVIFQGSIFFRALLFSSSNCDLIVNASALEFKLLNPKQIPCWLKQKLWLDSLPVDDQRVLLDFVVDQLELWFAVVGTTEDLPATAQMLQAVYGLPFTNCSSLHRETREEWLTALDINSYSVNYKGPLTYERYTQLQYDYGVQKALHADYKLYNKVVEIEHLQRQSLFNKLR